MKLRGLVDRPYQVSCQPNGSLDPLAEYLWTEAFDRLLSKVQFDDASGQHETTPVNQNPLPAGSLLAC